MNQSADKPKKVGLTRPPVKRENFFISYWGLWAVLIIFISFALISTGKAPHPGEGTEAAAAVKAPIFGEPGYVGSKRCKDCHWREFDAWKSTLHSRFVQVPGEYSVIGDFEKDNTLTEGNTTARMFRRDDKYYVNTVGPDNTPRDYEIAYVIGIGRRQNYITTFPNGEMHVLPVEWEVKSGKWVELNSAGNNHPGNGGSWSAEGSIYQIKCGGCHFTGLKINYDKDKDSFSSAWTEPGIGCEACHGPGSNHLKAASEYFDYEKETIVNPARLPWRLRATVCGQCHNWGASTASVSPAKAGFPARYGYAYNYLPGKALHLFYEPERDETKKHHQQYNEWEKSVHAQAGVMCTNCHNVHQVSGEIHGDSQTVQPAQTKLAADNLCITCHQTLQKRSAHRIHTFGSCIACHMPKTKGHEHSHTFEFISPAESVKAGGVDRKSNSCNNCHHHKDTPPENLVEFLNAAKKADMPIPFTVHGR